MTNSNNSNHKKDSELQRTETSGELILASASRWRARMLAAAGVEVEIMPPSLDEEALKRSMQAKEAAPAAIAQVLADAKALEISARRPDALVLAADQVMVCGNTLLCGETEKFFCPDFFL
jgi:predicted house-cleaning NTP pyrophosphatase (Maf/HAM1 superfamily)